MLHSLGVVGVEMEAILIQASEVFEVFFMFHTCLFTPIHSRNKLSSMLFKRIIITQQHLTKEAPKKADVNQSLLLDS